MLKSMVLESVTARQVRLGFRLWSQTAAEVDIISNNTWATPAVTGHPSYVPTISVRNHYTMQTYAQHMQMCKQMLLGSHQGSLLHWFSNRTYTKYLLDVLKLTFTSLCKYYPRFSYRPMLRQIYNLHVCLHFLRIVWLLQEMAEN